MSSGEQGSLFIGQFSPRKIFSETVDHFSGEFSSFLFKQKLFKSLFSCLGEKSGLNIFIQFGCLDLADKRELWRHLRSVRDKTWWQPMRFTVLLEVQKWPNPTWILGGQLFGEQHLPCWRAEDCRRHTSLSWVSPWVHFWNTLLRFNHRFWMHVSEFMVLCQNWITKRKRGVFTWAGKSWKKLRFYNIE